MSRTIELTKQLIACPSLTPEDAGCQQILAAALEALGATAKHLRFTDVDNLWLTHGRGDPLLCFVGHTDVVPAGAIEQWDSQPFTPEIRGDYLYGRGAADMKGSIAAFISALERFVSVRPEHPGTIALLITSDEEGSAVNGTRKVVDYLQSNNIRIKWCLVGEPSSEDKLGDTIKNGRRGSLNGKLTIHGVQGHVAYPRRADNPIHKILPALTELCARQWGQGDEHYPPTGMQISNIHGGTGADNVIPASIEVMFNYRFGANITEQTLQTETEKILAGHGLDYRLDWRLSGRPFLTKAGKLLEASRQAVKEITGREAQLSTTGGTSDGRFIAPTGAEVIELGPVNKTIHKVNECVNVEDLNLLSTIYESILKRLFS